MLCPSCFLRGFCRNLKARLVTDKELANPLFIADLKAYAHALQISADRWVPGLVSLYRDYMGEIVDANDTPVWLDTEVFEGLSIRYWFRDFCRPVDVGVVPRVRHEAWERVRAMATILRATDPVGTALWGMRPANDGSAPQMRPSLPNRHRCTVLSKGSIPTAIRMGRYR